LFARKKLLTGAASAKIIHLLSETNGKPPSFHFPHCTKATRTLFSALLSHASCTYALPNQDDDEQRHEQPCPHRIATPRPFFTIHLDNGCNCACDGKEEGNETIIEAHFTLPINNRMSYDG
jgi:hypothetical protein